MNNEINPLKLGAGFKVLAYLHKKNTLISSKKPFMSEIQKETYITYSYINQIISKLKILGFVTTKKVGRTLEVSLTSKGDDYCAHILALQDGLREVVAHE